MYMGLVHEDGRHEYYFGNDTEEAAELRGAAAIQLGMLLCVLADRSDSSIEELPPSPPTGPGRWSFGNALTATFSSSRRCQRDRRSTQI